MIYVYADAYWCNDYILSCIRNLRNSTKEKFNLTVGENKSPNSNIIKEVLKKEVENGNIDTYIRFDENLLSSCLKYAYRLNPPKDESGDFIVFTNTDLKVPNGVDWIQELRKRFAYSEVGLVAFDLDIINYYDSPAQARFSYLVEKVSILVPQQLTGVLKKISNVWPLRGHNWGQLFANESSLDSKYQIYKDLFSGMWLCGVRKNIVDKFVDSYDTFLDRHLNYFAQSSGFIIGRIPIKLYHYGWDAWKDYPEYYRYKLSILHEFHNEPRKLCSYEIIRKGERIDEGVVKE